MFRCWSVRTWPPASPKPPRGESRWTGCSPPDCGPSTRPSGRGAPSLIPALADTPRPVDLPLPLARCPGAGGDQWHWAATCAYPQDRVPDLPPEVHTWTGRTDPRALEHLCSALPAVLPERQGRYRARRMPLLVTTRRAVSWHAVGDPEQVLALLTGVTTIGKKRRTGEGHVLAWEVLPAPELDRWSAAHLHPDGTLGRPTPQACLTGRRVPAGGYGTAGLRPPYFHPARQHPLRLRALLDG